MKINYLPLALKGVIDFLPPFRDGVKEENQHNLICLKADNQFISKHIFRLTYYHRYFWTYKLVF